MRNQLVEVKDFPGFTVGDAIKIATHRLTEQGYRNIEPLPPLPRRVHDGLWRLSFRVAVPLRPEKAPYGVPDQRNESAPPPIHGPVQTEDNVNGRGRKRDAPAG